MSDATELTATTTPHGTTRLDGWGVIAAEGEDAARFLHGQLTQDIALMGLSQARLAAFCSAKGRMLASFVAVKPDHQRVLLLCSRDLLPATLKRLQMFVLRAQVKLRDASDEHAVFGLVGSAVPTALPSEPWSHLALGRASAVRLYPAAGHARALWVGAAGDQPGAAALPAAVWAWLDVLSGVATVSQPVVDAFVPQMLNYESVGGVNFKKGCYPGQEVVARSQFRGTLKRRAYVVHADAELAPGQEVFTANDLEQPCGTVVQAAANPQSGWDAIVSMQTAAAEAGELRAGAATLNVLPLPYPLLDDI